MIRRRQCNAIPAAATDNDVLKNDVGGLVDARRYPVDQQVECDELSHEMEHDSRWQRLARYVRGGYWRNFKVRYG